MSIDWKSVEVAIIDWAYGKLGDKFGMSRDQLQWADQNLPQPPYPFVTFKRDTVLRFGLRDETRQTYDPAAPSGEEIELETTGPREFTLQITASVDEETGSNDPNCDAMAINTLLQSSLSQLSTQEILCIAGLVVVEELAVVDISEEVNGERISEAVMDVRMRATSSITERTTYIETAQIRSIPCNPSGPSDVQGVDITVSGN